MKVVIVGGVAGGMSAATRLRRLDADAEIIVLEKSGHVSYANCGLPYFVGGIIEEEKSLFLQTPQSLHARFRLDVRVSTEATRIDPATKTLEVLDLASGEKSEISYDKLILSPGANPVIPPIPGIERAITLRTVEDVEKIVAQVNEQPQNAVVIGGGFIGLEVAENLAHKGIPTTVVEALPQVLAPLDPEMASLVADELINHGVQVFLGNGVASISQSSVSLSSGEVLPAELVILAIGVRPDISLAKMANLEIGDRGGIAVNDVNLTSDPNIYAVGDAAEKKDSIDGSATLVPLANLANRHGRVVADHIAGLSVRPVRTIGTAIVKVFDLTIATTGWNEKRLVAQKRGFHAVHTHPASHAGYYPGAKPMSLKLLFDSQTGEILGAQGVGTEGVDKRIDVIATAMRGGITAPELADLELAYAPPFGSAKDPVNMLGYIAENRLSGLSKAAQWSEIEEYRDRGYEIVDVRTRREFARGSIPGSTNIPIDELRERLGEIGSHDVLVNCQVGLRGHTAALLLTELGFNAVNLDGGYQTWSMSPANTAVFALS
ncbi:MAG TPA: FAD-dependent oxidoreductase [Candidatus Nanopelagicaceae bacterium]|jgi:NADPH-dependent 2,4-dienoyl-CoA reductase/sulfur reductase-like enzyme/rhodanese-related sulfurtransferase